MGIKCTVEELKLLINKETSVTETTDVTISNNDKVILSNMLTNLQKICKEPIAF